MRLLGTKSGIEMAIHKKMPLSSGLGSSAASAVAGALATHAALGGTLAKRDLLPACLAAEAVVSVAHVDNIAASMLGGFVIVEGTNPVAVHQVTRLPDVHVALITPDKEVPTRKARQILPEHVRLMDGVRQWSKVAVMVHAIYEGNGELFARSIDDRIIEPRRARLVPRFKKLKEAAFVAGAHGVSISGAAPTVFAVCTDPRVAERVAEAMKRVYDLAGIESETRVARPDPEGARIV
jgi:homoserine kinase